VNQAQQYFSSLVELAKDEDVIGQVLRHYPYEVLRAADKWAEQNAEYAAKHKTQIVCQRLILGSFFSMRLQFPKETRRCFVPLRASLEACVT
jgi:hypothetical protein